MPSTPKQPDSIAEVEHEATPKSVKLRLSSQSSQDSSASVVPDSTKKSSNDASDNPSEEPFTSPELVTASIGHQNPTGFTESVCNTSQHGNSQIAVYWYAFYTFLLVVLTLLPLLKFPGQKWKLGATFSSASGTESSSRQAATSTSATTDSNEPFPNIWEKSKHCQLDPRAFDSNWSFTPEAKVFVRNEKVFESFKDKTQEFTSFVAAQPGNELRISLERFLFLLVKETELLEFEEYDFEIDNTDKPVYEFPKLYRILRARGLRESACDYNVVRFKPIGSASQRLQALRIYGLLIPFETGEICEIVLLDPNHQILGTDAARRHKTDFRSTNRLQYPVHSVLSQEAKKSLLLAYQRTKKWYHDS